MKKSTKKKPKIKKQVKPGDSVITRGEYLQTLIRMTENCVNPKYSDTCMADQATRLKLELKQWEKANPK